MIESKVDTEAETGLFFEVDIFETGGIVANQNDIQIGTELKIVENLLGEAFAIKENHILVKTSWPRGVTKIVCSNWAERELS